MMLKQWCLGTLVLLFCLPDWVVADPLKLKLKTSVAQTYNDNVFFETDDPLEDFVTHVSPGLQIGWETAVTVLRLEGRADMYYHQDHDELDAVDRSCSSHWTRRWNPRFSTTVSVDYLDDERRDRELSETGLLFSDDRRRRWSCGVSGQYQVSALAAVSASYSYRVEEFDDALIYDLYIHTAQLLFTRSLAPFLERGVGRLQLVAGRYGYTRQYETKDPSLDLFDTDVDDEQAIDHYSASLGLDYLWSERLSVRADLGARFTRNKTTRTYEIASNPFDLAMPPSETRSESWGYVAMLEGVYAGYRSQFSVTASHDLVPASGREGTTERTTLQLEYSERLAGQWHVDGSARGYLNRSDGSDVTAEDEELTVELRAGLRYVFDPRWSAGLYCRSTWIDDRELDKERRQNRVTLRLRWNFAAFE